MAMAMAPAATLLTRAEAVSAAPGDPGEPVVIGVTGDFGWNHPGVLAEHGALVKSIDPDFVVTTGDNVQTMIPADGTDKYDFTVGRNFCDFLKGAAPGPFCTSGGTSSGNRFFPATGNHDHMEGDGGGPISNFLDYFDLPGAGTTSEAPTSSELYYDVRLGPVHVFVLDSDSMLQELNGVTNIPGWGAQSPTDVQRAWLESTATASDAPWKVVAMHHSPYSSAAYEAEAGYGSSPWIQWPYSDWDVDAVMSGHHHAYERVALGGVQYVTNGMGGDYPRTFTASPVTGSQIRFNEDTMVVSRLAATNTTLTFEAHDVDGNIVDRFDLGEVAGPTAVATATPTSGIAPLEVQLNGSGSLNPAGGSLTYEWDTDGDGDYDDATGVNPTVTFTNPVQAEVRLKVTDTNGNSSISPVVSINVAAAQGPAVTTAPAVSGSTVPGSTLTVTNGTWTGTAPITYSTQWQRCAPANAAAYTAAVSADSPLLHWRLGETSGANAADASGNSRTGTYINTVQRNQASALLTDSNPAVGFNGGEGRVERADLTGMPTTGISAELWIKTADQKNSGLISYAVEGNSDELHITNPDSLTVAVIGTRINSGVAVNDGQWHHVVATWTSATGTLTIYVDGVSRFTQADVRTGGTLTGGGTLVLGQEQDAVGGGFDSSQALSGQMDEVALYPSVLDSTRIAQHYLSATGLNCSNISGATGSTYSVKNEDVDSLLRARVTATNQKRSVTASSSTVGPVSVAAVNPVGALDNPTSPSPAMVKVSGWAADGSSATTALDVDVYIGGPAGTAGVEKQTIRADKTRAGIPAEYGADHGFEATLATAKRGTQQVCVVARNVGGGADTSLGCKSVAIVNPNPFGHYQSVSSPKAGQVRVDGWAIDRSTPTTALKMQVIVGGPRGTRGAESFIIDANRRRDDVARSYPGTGSNHGFDATVATKKRGKQQVCVYALNTGTGQDVNLGCKEVVVK